jgi:hypothetical protein
MNQEMLCKLNFILDVQFIAQENVREDLNRIVP